jgi:DNA-binding transcriptional regulator YiaG
MHKNKNKKNSKELKDKTPSEPHALKESLNLKQDSLARDLMKSVMSCDR